MPRRMQKISTKTVKTTENSSREHASEPSRKPQGRSPLFFPKQAQADHRRNTLTVYSCTVGPRLYVSLSPDA